MRSLSSFSRLGHHMASNSSGEGTSGHGSSLGFAGFLLNITIPSYRYAIVYAFADEHIVRLRSDSLVARFSYDTSVFGGTQHCHV